MQMFNKRGAFREDSGFVRFLLCILIGGLGYAAIKILNLLDYTVKRDKDNIYISCGKLKKTNYSFNICRINAVFLR